jgi:hypothetical protein
MAFDQPNQSSHRPQQQVPPPQQPQAEQPRSSPLPPIGSEEWEYNGYNGGPGYSSSSYPPHRSPPQQHQMDYANRTTAYPSSASAWEQVYIKYFSST